MTVNKYFKILKTLSDSDSTEYEVQFRITDACNLKCEYCCWNNGPQYKTDDILKCIDQLEIHFNNIGIKSVTFYFHGGEPSTHKDLEIICKRIKEISIKTVIEVQTNLIKDISHIKEIDYFSVSLHYNELIRTNNLETFKNNYAKIPNINNLDIMLENVNDNKKYYEFILNLENKFKNSEMIYGYFGGYISDHKKFYDKHNKSVELFDIDGVKYNTNDLFSKGLDCRKCKCKTTRTQLYCNGNGDIYFCATHLTIDNKNPVMNILKDSINKLKIYKKIDIKCKWNNCIDYFVERYIV